MCWRLYPTHRGRLFVSSNCVFHSRTRRLRVIGENSQGTRRCRLAAVRRVGWAKRQRASGVYSQGNPADGWRERDGSAGLWSRPALRVGCVQMLCPIARYTFHRKLNLGRTVILIVFRDSNNNNNNDDKKYKNIYKSWIFNLLLLG